MLCGKKSRKRHALAPMDLNLKILSQKYRFSAKELAQCSSEFKKLSQETSGFSLKAFCKNMGPLGLDSTRLISDRIFTVMNKSKTGQVSLQEYLEYMDILMHGTQNEKLHQSYRLVTQDKSSTINYQQFESWIISVWKMRNALTGAEISATKENIQNFFSRIDFNNDGEIDFEEFKVGINENSNLGEWFQSIFHDISKKFEWEKEPVEEENLITKVSNDIQSCIQDLSYALSGIYDSDQEDLENEPEIILPFEKLPQLQGDLDSFISESHRPLTHCLEKVIQKLTLIASDIMRISIAEPNKDPQPQTILSKQSLIRWGDNDWNLIMNMMIGIQKSINSLPETPANVSSSEFLSKSHQSLLPAKHARNSYKFVDYSPLIFQRLRTHFGVSASEYIKSLGVEKIIQSLMANEFSSLSGQCSEGKSGSFFFYSADGRFMLKTITDSEYKLFLKILPDYYFHMLNNPESLLTRFYGLYKIKGSNPLYFVVMGSVFTSCYEVHQKFDLKGSRYGRKADPGADKSIARKDLDFDTKLFIGKKRKKLLVDQIDSDIELLQRLNVIDYSFLIGIHEVHEGTEALSLQNRPFWQENNGGMLSSTQEHLYFVGIIDFLTEFGTKKKLEHLIMGTLHGKKEVSCVPPAVYSKRFLNFIESIIE